MLVVLRAGTGGGAGPDVSLVGQINFCVNSWRRRLASRGLALRELSVRKLVPLPSVYSRSTDRALRKQISIRDTLQASQARPAACCQPESLIGLSVPCSAYSALPAFSVLESFSGWRRTCSLSDVRRHQNNTSGAREKMNKSLCAIRSGRGGAATLLSCAATLDSGI